MNPGKDMRTGDVFVLFVYHMLLQNDRCRSAGVQKRRCPDLVYASQTSGKHARGEQDAPQTGIDSSYNRTAIRALTAQASERVDS